MTSITQVAKTPSKRLAVITGFALATCVALSAGPLAQGGGTAATRLNPIIAQFEQGKPSFAMEQWQLFGIEHNPFIFLTMEQGFKALRPEGSSRPRLAPFVRLEYEGDQDYKQAVKQWLDVGAMGIVVPHVLTAAEARKFVSYMRYPPQKVSAGVPRDPVGVRGSGAGRAQAYWGVTAQEYATKADVWPLNPQGELLAMVMFEDIRALSALKDILSVPGLAGVMIGQNDLTLSMGLGTPAADDKAQNNPEVQAVVAAVGRTCVAMKKLCGTFQGDIATRVGQGFRLFTQERGGFKD
jgi:4-hydroxy-2-oxoheptanedioate aldolase